MKRGSKTEQYRGLFMGTATWPDIALAFKKDWPIVIPLGAACKEHSFHLPMNTDQIQAEYYANWIAQNFPVCVAPNIPYHFFPAFIEYPDSAQIYLETATQMVIDLCVTWHKQGAPKIYVLNMSISTNKPLSAAKKILAEKNIEFDFFDLSAMDEHPDIMAITQQKNGTHADEIETSVMLYIKPEVVQIEKAVSEDTTPKEGPLTPNISATDKHVSVSGAWGNPLLATKEKGEITVRVIKEMLKKDLEKLLNSQPNLGIHSHGLHSVAASDKDANSPPTGIPYAPF